MLKLMSARSHSLIAALLACVLSAPACLRFGYNERAKAGDADAGMDAAIRDGGQPVLNGGQGGAGAAGRGGAGSGGRSGTGGSRGNSEPRDAGLDAEPVPEDAATQDSATPDAGAADGGKAGVLCPDIPALLFCDGFEDVRLEDSWGYSAVQDGSAMRVTDFRRTGVASLHATTTGPSMQGTWARWATEALNKQRNGHAWMRSYNWLPGSAKIMPYFSLGAMSENVQPYDGFELRLRPAHVEISATGGVWGSMMVPFPRDRWVCVELHAFIDPAVGFYEVYFDEILVITSALHDTQPADGITAAEVGIHYAAPMQPATEVYVDDVAVGTARIPCQ